MALLLVDARRRAPHVLQRVLQVAGQRALLRGEAVDLRDRPAQRRLELALRLGVLVGAPLGVGARLAEHLGQPLHLGQRRVARVRQLGQLGEDRLAIGAEPLDLRRGGGARAPETLDACARLVALGGQGLDLAAGARAL